MFLFFPIENNPFVKAACSIWSSPTGPTVLSLCLSHMRLIHAQSQYKEHILPISFLSLTINLSLFLLLLFSLSVQQAGVMALHVRSMNGLIMHHKLASLAVRLCISTPNFLTELHSIFSVPASDGSSPELSWSSFASFWFFILCTSWSHLYGAHISHHMLHYEPVCVNSDDICTSTSPNDIICTWCMLHI